MNLKDKLKYNPANPRIIKKDEYELLKHKIRNFPQMLEKRPIVYDEDMVVLGGNQRLRVLRDLVKEGFVVKDEYFADASGWTEEQKRQFVITDNISDGLWDYDVLANKWDDLPLEDWGIYIDGWKNTVIKNKEINPDELTKDLNTTCPKCGFEFNSKEANDFIQNLAKTYGYEAVVDPIGLEYIPPVTAGVSDVSDGAVAVAPRTTTATTAPTFGFVFTRKDSIVMMQEKVKLEKELNEAYK